MPKNMSIAPHERGWAVLYRNVLINVYPSRYLALQAVEHLKEEEQEICPMTGDVASAIHPPFP